jgi:hypothetical protein
MPAGFNHVVNTSAIVAGMVLMATTSLADTTIAPNMSLSLTSSSSGNDTFDPASYGNVWANGNGTFSYSGQKTANGSHKLGWSMIVNPDPFVIANFVVSNTSAVTQTFTLTVTLPLGGVVGPFSEIGGSVTGSVTDLNGNGATLATAAGTPIYQALADGNIAGTLLNDPTSVSTGAFGSAVVGPAQFGDGGPGGIPSLPYVAINTDIAITLTFTLTAGDSASFTSIFAVEASNIPAPGALALVGIAGLVGSRRRRA